jgi:hypothetical protein
MCQTGRGCVCREEALLLFFLIQLMVVSREGEKR